MGSVCWLGDLLLNMASPQVTLISALFCWAADSIAAIFCLIDRVETAFLFFAPVTAALFWFSGIIVDGPKVIWPIRILYYALPSKYYFEPYLYLLFADDTW